MKNRINIFSSNCTRELAQRVVEKINSNRSDIDNLTSDEDELVLGDCKLNIFKTMK